MSSIVNKVKHALGADKHDAENPNSSNHGSHNTAAANKADPRIDSDLDNRGTHNTSGLTGTHNTGVTGSHGTSGLTGTSHSHNTAGPHNSDALNKADPRVDSDLDGRGAHGTGLTGTHNTGVTGTHGTSGLTGTSHNTTAGPHSSNLANKADPRVDSDLDGRGNHGTGAFGSSGTHTGSSGLGANVGPHGEQRTGFTGTSHNTNTAGPHNSDALNKLDPRVDSDRDGRGAAYGTTGTSGLTGTSHNTTAGPHSSNIANKADPRVDSDLDGRGTHTGTHNTGLTGTHGTSGLTGTSHNTTAGPHSSNIANKADPRVDSDLDGRGAHRSGLTEGTHATGGLGSTGFGHNTGSTGVTGHNTTGTHTGTSGLTGTHGTTGHSGVGHNQDPANVGMAPKTAGPHKSDILNKLDPRVDSNLDGSKTIGKDQTFSQ